MEPFKRSNETAVFIIIVAILLLLAFWSLRIPIINAVTFLWQKPVTADLPSVYFNDDVSYHFTKCPDEDVDKYQEYLKDKEGKMLFSSQDWHQDGKNQIPRTVLEFVCLSH